MQKLKDSIGNILFYAGLVFIVLSIIGGFFLWDELSDSLEYLALVSMVFGI